MKRALMLSQRSAFILPISLIVSVPFSRAGVFPGTNWEVRSPADQKLDSTKLDQFSAAIGGRGCVVRNGYLVHSWGRSISTPEDIASAAKIFYSHFLFTAIKEGRVASVDAKAAKFEPRLNSINAALGHKDKNITFRQLANQTACYGVREIPGAAFNYNDFQMALFFDILMLKVFDQTLKTVDAKILRSKLTNLIKCQDHPTFLAFGTEDRPGRMKISPRDFARFGLLYLNKGK